MRVSVEVETLKNMVQSECSPAANIISRLSFSTIYNTACILARHDGVLGSQHAKNSKQVDFPQVYFHTTS